MKPYKILTLFLLLYPFGLMAAGTGSKHRATVEILDEKLTATATSLIKLNSTLATITTAITIYDDGSLTSEWGTTGDLRFGSVTTASRTALTASAGRVIYDAGNSALYVGDGSSWNVLGSGTGSGSSGGAASFTINSISVGSFTFVAGSNMTLVTASDSNNATFTFSASISGSGNDAISIWGTNIDNTASPTAGQVLRYDNPTGEYVATVAITASDSSEIDFTMDSTGLLTASITAASIVPGKISTTNVGVASDVLAYDGTNFVFSPQGAGGGGGSSATLNLQGALLTHDGADPVQLSPGAASEVLGIDSLGNVVWSEPWFIVDPTTTDGDIIRRDAGSIDRLSIGATGQILTVSALGAPEWENAGVPSNIIMLASYGLSLDSNTSGATVTYTYSNIGGGHGLIIGSSTPAQLPSHSGHMGWNQASGSLYISGSASSSLNWWRVDLAPQGTLGTTMATQTTSSNLRTSPGAVVWNDELWAIEGDRALKSTDLGATWATQTASIGQANNGTFLSKVVIFDDGTEKIWSFGGNDWSGGASATENVWSSSDGITWAEVATGTTAGQFGIDVIVWDAGSGDRLWTWGGDVGNKILNSSDGVTWSQVSSYTYFNGNFSASVLKHDGKVWNFGLGSDTSSVHNSTDLASWTYIGEANTDFINAEVVSIHNRMYAFGGTGLENTIRVSVDGINWTSYTGATSVFASFPIWQLGDDVIFTGGHSTRENIVTIATFPIEIQRAVTLNGSENKAWQLVAGTNITIASASSGGTTSFTVSSSAGGGGGSVTASPTIQATSEIDGSVDTSTNGNVISLDLVANGIQEGKMDITNAGTDNFFLMYANGSMTWHLATNTITATGTNTITASPTVQDTSEIDLTLDNTGNANLLLADLVDGGVDEPKLKITNTGTDNYFLMYANGSMTWHVATDTNTVTATGTNTLTASPTILATSEIDGSVDSSTNGNILSFDLVTGGVQPVKLETTAAGVDGYFLMYTNGSMTWHLATNTITATGTNTITASPTVQDTSEIDLTLDNTGNANLLLADLIDNGVDEPKLKISNSGVDNYFLMYANGSMTWHIATNTITASASVGATTATTTIQAEDDSLIVFQDPDNNISSWSLKVRDHQTSARAIQGTVYDIATPTADQLYWFNATSSLMVPMTITAGTNVAFRKEGNSLIIDSSASGSSGGSATGTLNFRTFGPGDNGQPCAVATETGAMVFISTASTTADFGNELFEGDWDETSDLKLSFMYATIGTQETATAVFRLDLFTMGLGNGVRRSASYTQVATFVIDILSTSSTQIFDYTVDSNFVIPAASLTRNMFIYPRITATTNHASYTVTDEIEIYGLWGTYDQ